MSNFVRKITSRKFIVTAIAAIAGVVTLFVGENEIVDTIAGMAMTVIPTIVYCAMEGYVDAQSVKTVTKATADAAEKLGADKIAIDAIEKVGAVGEVLASEEDVDDVS